MKLTLFLVTVNVFVFFFSITDPEFFVNNFAFSIDSFLSGKFHTVVTSMFLHADLLHLGSNMIALLLLGSAVESKVKEWKYLLVYFLSGIAGNLTLFIPLFNFSSSTIAVGASAAISGLIGLGIFVSPGKLTFFPIIIPIPFVLAGALYFLVTYSLLFVESSIGYPAHLSGLIAGAVFGFNWSKSRYRNLILFGLSVVFILILPYILPAIFSLFR